MEALFFSDDAPVGGRALMVDELEGQVWAYLTLPNNTQMAKDGFLAARKPISRATTNHAARLKRYPPPVPLTHASDRAYLPDLAEEQFSVRWNAKGDGAVLLIEAEPFLFFLPTEKMAYTKAISQSGPFGHPWDEELYRAHFG